VFPVVVVVYFCKVRKVGVVGEKKESKKEKENDKMT